MPHNTNIKHIIGLCLVLLLALGCNRWFASGTSPTPSTSQGGQTVTTVTEKERVTTTQPAATQQAEVQPQKPALNVQITPGSVPAQQTAPQPAQQPAGQFGTQQPPAQPQR